VRVKPGVVVAVLAGLNAACTLLTDTDGLTRKLGAENPDATPDAQPGDGGLADADANAGDGTTETDGAGKETGGDANLPDAAPVCPSGSMVMCDAFERAGVLGAWKGTNIGGGAAVDLLSEGSSRFLHVTSPGTDMGAEVDGELYVDFNTDAIHVFFDYDLRYSKLPTGTVELQTIYFRHAAGAYSEISVALDSSGVNFFEQSSNNVTLTPIAIPSGTWHHIYVEAHIAGALLVKVDGVVALSKPLATFITKGPPSLSAGVVYGTRPPTGLTVDVDNIVFRATP
jgi:hypothetical protein